jgi:hypothetical protein
MKSYHGMRISRNEEYIYRCAVKRATRPRALPCARTASLPDQLSVAVGPPALSVSETPTYTWESGLAPVIARVFRSACPDAAGFAASCGISLCRKFAVSEMCCVGKSQCRNRLRVACLAIIAR